MTNNSTEPEQPGPRKKDGRGSFFAVDRRAWAWACELGMNAAIAYLVAACGTGGDNRTTKWSTNAIERRTGISRSRAALAIAALERAGLLWRDPQSKRDHPKYKMIPAHEIPGCEGYPPAALRAGHKPAIPYDAEAAAKPDWIWLPNTLVDGASGEIAPIELIRQTDNVQTLRLLVNFYGAHNLAEDGGVHFGRICQQYERHKVGERGPFTVWGFTRKSVRTFSNARFVAPHLTGNLDESGSDKGWTAFWGCWNSLIALGLVETVAHLVHSDSNEGEIIHPMALGGTGLEIEREVARAAHSAAMAMITEGQRDWAIRQGIVALAPVPTHIANVQMVGIARLRYRPRTARTLAFISREAEWREIIARLREIAAEAVDDLATSRRHQGVSR